MFSLSDLIIGEYYDKPILFAGRDGFGIWHIVVLADDGDGFEDWLVVQVSPARLAAITLNQIGLHQAFAEPESGVAYRVRDFHSGPRVAKLIPKDQIDANDLPMEGEYWTKEQVDVKPSS